ncbi:MAG: H-NS histone family protein [Pseudomonadota bacterium]
MKKKPDLSQMSLKELETLAKDVEKAIEKKISDNLKEARAAAESAARKYGLSLDEVLGTQRKTKAPAKSLPPKYRHPDDAKITWSGKGRQPGWFRDAIASGKTSEDLLI